MIPIIMPIKNSKSLKVITNLLILKNESISNFLLTISLFFFGISVNYAQTIKGVVQDINGNPLSAKLLVKNSSNPDVISEYVLVVNGKYSYVLKKKYANEIIIQVTSIGYNASLEHIINSKDTKSIIELNFSLLKEKIQELDEVFIKDKKRPFNIKKDTIVYNVDSYKDGTEKKLEDLLKKLPGVEIDENNGLIKYRGTPIETITIEGDNLFDYNYTIGTKNINIDLVKEIEAIENYSENSLLKGIEQSNKVALNLKLKNRKTDVSGNIDFGTGDFSNSKKTPIKVGVNLLGINKFYKSFAVLAQNNIGLNLSPFNYFSNQINLEQIREQEYYAEETIPTLNLPDVTSENLSNINNQFFSNFNSIFNFSEQLKTKINLFYIKDEINSNQFSENSFNINNETFTAFDNLFIKKNPFQYRGDIELKLITSKSSLLQYNISLRDETINTNQTIFSNQENDFISSLTSKNKFLKQHVQYTKKLTDKKAIQIDLLHSTNSLNQYFSITPSLFNTSETDRSLQNNNTKKHYLDFKGTLLAAKINDNYSFTFGASLSKEPFQSVLGSQNNTSTLPVENGINNLEYKQNVVYSLGSYHWKFKKLKIATNYSLKFLDQNLDLIENSTSVDSDLFIFEPSLNLSYKLNRISFLNINMGLNRNTNTIQNLFPNSILINNRILLNNLPNLTLQKNQSIGLSYDKNDLFNQLEISLGINYVKQQGGFFSNSLINANSLIVENFFSPEKTENLNINMNFSKLIPVLKTTLKINSTYSVYNFINIVNSSELRNNKSNYITNQIFLKTAFASKINFENKTNYIYQDTKNENLFKSASFQNKLKIIVKPSKQVYGDFTIDYFIPNLEKKTNDYSFLSTKIWYKPKNKNWEANFSGTNLLNLKEFGQFNSNDISTSVSSINLLNRLFLLNFSYSF